MWAFDVYVRLGDTDDLQEMILSVITEAEDVDALHSGRETRKLMCVPCAQLGMALCDPTDCSLPGSSVHGIFHARILE